MLRAAVPAGGSRVRGTDAAVRTAIASLLEHALAASPTGATIRLAVRDAPAGAVVVEIAAPEATGLGAIAVERLDTLLDTTLRDLRGDFSLVLAGALADAVGGAVTRRVESGQRPRARAAPRGRVNLALTRPQLDGK